MNVASYNRSGSTRLPPTTSLTSTGSGGGGGLFSLVDGLRGSSSASSKLEFPPALHGGVVNRPPLYTPPNTAPAGGKTSSFAPPLAAAIVRPPTTGVTSATNQGPDQSSQASRRLNSPIGAGSFGRSQGHVREQLPMPQLRRPPSTGTSGAAFHKGLVNALQDVLRKQRNGVFPRPDGLDEVPPQTTSNRITTPMSRPSTQQGATTSPRNTTSTRINSAGIGATSPSSFFPNVETSSGSFQPEVGAPCGPVPTNSTASSHPTVSPNSNAAADIEELIRRKKTEWARKRWQSLQEKERRELERDITSANALGRRFRMTSGGPHGPGSTSGSLFNGPGDDFGFEIMRLVQAVERQEATERALLSQQFLKHAQDMRSSFSTFIRAKRWGTTDGTRPSSMSSAPSAAFERLWDVTSPNMTLSNGGEPAPSAPLFSSSNAGGKPPSRPSTRGSQPHFPSDHQTSSASTSNPSSPTSRLSIDELKAEGNRFYEQNDFAGAYMAYTQAIELDPHNAVLFANRAASHMMLLNYDACAKDCLVALGIDSQNLKVLQRLAKSYALAGHHRPAAAHYTNALKLAKDVGASPTLTSQLEDEAASVLTLEKMRRASEMDQHHECLALSTTLKSFQGEPPVILLRGTALAAMDATAARQELSRYFSTLECPTQHGTSSSATIVSGFYFNHYCDVLVLLAKASFNCGQHYMSIANTYVKQCLALRPEYRQAMALSKLISSLESHLEESNAFHQNGKFAEAHAALSLALALDTNNKKIRGGIFVTRAELSVKLGNLASAISDCSAALECDPTLVKAYTRRAKCFSEIGDFDRAVRDMERAAELNPALADDLRAFRSQRQDDASSFQNFSRRFSASGSGRQRGTSSGTGGDRPGTGRGGMEACPYQALQLPRFSPMDQVKQQYKKLILQYHPDKVVNEPQHVRDACAAKFREVSQAYSVLSDAVGKSQYDNSNR